MIDPKQLRIGNLVQSPTHNLAVATVSDLLPSSGLVMLDEVLTYDYFEKIEPIPITAKWLKANGFADTQDSYYRRCIQNEDTLSPTMLVISRGFAEISRSGIGAIAAPCKYVHQLMNLYYSLTGEELTVKEKV